MIVSTIPVHCKSPMETKPINPVRFDCFASVDEVPVDQWNSFVSTKTVGLELNHLRAVEISRINDFHPYYLIAYDGDRPLGITYCFSMDMSLAGLADSHPPEVLETVKSWIPDFMKVRILEVGHPASLGSTVCMNENGSARFLSALMKELDRIASAEKADLCFLRDIPAGDCDSFAPVEKGGFKRIDGFPIARISIGWEGFDQYMDSLKSRKRNSFGRIREKMDYSEIAVEVIEDYAPYANELAELWANVAKSNNGYNHERLTPAYFESMAFHMKGRSHVVAIKLNGRIVAFGLNLIGDEEYFGMAEGLDYEVRDLYDLYGNNIFEGLKIACESGKKSFNLGVTTYDYKQSVGAELDPCFYYIKSCGNPDFTAVYADVFEKVISKQRTGEHRVFNRTYLEKSKDGDIRSIDRSSDNIPQSASDLFSKLYDYLRVDEARSSGLYTYCPRFESAQRPVIRHDGRDVIMLGANSYLGLSTDRRVKEAMHNAIEKYGSGCSGSPLLNGTLDIHEELASRLARFTGKEHALLFSTGYQTNLGVLSALAGRGDVLIMDRRNHASLNDGARLSGATLVRYGHNDMASLETALRKYNDRPKLVVTDSVFSMEGTVADLPEIVRLCGKYRARLMVDESHGIGVLGREGSGLASHLGLTGKVDILMGTFSKSFASIGGFISGDRKVIDALKHKARSHIFSASLPPSAIAAVSSALDIIESEPDRVATVKDKARYMARGLRNLGFQVNHFGSAIVSLFCGHELIALAAFRKLFDEGVFVNPVTYPAVPKKGEMLRISLMATHSEEILDLALQVFKKIRTEQWPRKAGGDLL